mgnify:CR=1 FL=1
MEGSTFVQYRADSKQSVSVKDVVVIDTLFEAVKLRDPATAEHSLAMAYYNYLIACEFDRQNSKLYYLSGLVHDVGKLAMKDDVLKGSKVLAPEEKEYLKEHVTEGVYILERLKLPELVVQVAKSHHERYDGSGYCEGLAGEDIPLCGRIAAIADTYATLVGGRPYAGAVSSSEALEVMRRESYLFDPVVLEWFVDFAEEKSKYLSYFKTAEFKRLPLAAL